MSYDGSTLRSRRADSGTAVMGLSYVLDWYVIERSSRHDNFEPVKALVG